MRVKLLSATAVALVAGILVAPSAPAAVGADSSALRQAVTVDGIMEHEQAFQDIADANGDTRASGTPGYDESADYVADTLADAGYVVTRQPFEFAFFQELAESEFDRVSPDPELYINGVDFLTMEYSGSGDVTDELQATNDIVIPPGAEASTSNSGCEDADFAGFVEGNVALIQRGTCTFGEKAVNAEEAGASAVIIFNEGQEGRQEVLNGTLGGPVVTIPVLGTSFEVGEELYSLLQGNDPVIVHVFTETTSETRQTENVIGTTPGGRTDRRVIAGAHLDSVPEGPGINDNGSGSAVLLEIAQAFSELEVQPRNQVSFAFWGAEESGLIGSEYYVSQLSKRQIKDIALNLNFDMVGSPNYVRFVYDGDGDATGTAGPTGSGVIEDVFLDYFSSQGLASEPTAFDGRSDYASFTAVGIPAGGLFTGAEGIKTEEEAAEYGGVAGAPYDPCYHQACDDITNLNEDALDEMSDATAHAILTFAMTTSAVPGTDKSSEKAKANAASLEFKGSHLRK